MVLGIADKNVVKKKRVLHCLSVNRWHWTWVSLGSFDAAHWDLHTNQILFAQVVHLLSYCQNTVLDHHAFGGTTAGTHIHVIFAGICSKGVSRLQYYTIESCQDVGTLTMSVFFWLSLLCLLYYILCNIIPMISITNPYTHHYHTVDIKQQCCSVCVNKGQCHQCQMQLSGKECSWLCTYHYEHQAQCLGSWEKNCVWVLYKGSK